MNKAVWAMLNETEKGLLRQAEGQRRTPIRKRASAADRAATKRVQAARDAR